jgi:hypothetical protein
MVRRWITFCLAKFWENFDEVKWCAIRNGAHEKLPALLTDPVPEVFISYSFSKNKPIQN